MYVYFAATDKTRGGGKRRLKIGKSRNPEKRIKTLQTGNSEPIRLIGTIKCKSDNHALEIEKEAHKMFGKNHLRGEWFKITDMVICKIYELTMLTKPW